LRSRGIRYSNDGVAESAFFCNEKISDLHSPHSGRDRWTVAAQNTGSRFLSRARILEIRNARARELLESKHARFLSARKQTSGSVSTSPERAGLALSRLELPTVVCAGLSHSLSRTEGILSGAVRTTLSLSSTASTTRSNIRRPRLKKKKTRERVCVAERARERASGRTSRRSKARHAVVGVASLASRSPISPTPRSQPTTNFGTAWGCHRLLQCRRAVFLACREPATNAARRPANRIDFFLHLPLSMTRFLEILSSQKPRRGSQTFAPAPAVV
jgi:hypothetical protein